MYIMNANTPYYEDLNGDIIFMLMAAIGTTVAALAMKNKVVVDLCRVASSALIIYGGGLFISMRVESFGYIYGSNLELGNQLAFDAGGQAIALIVIFVVTWIISLAASFLEVGKKN
jgi:hypothetical protein